MRAERILQVAGVLFVLLLWQTASARMNEITMASPRAAFLAAASMLTDREFLTRHLAVTMIRATVSLAAGTATGFFLGLFAGRFAGFAAFFEPMRRVLTSIPGIVAAVLAMLWFGLGSTMVIALNTVFIIPVVYLQVAESIRACDRTYIEMAQVYRLSIRERIAHIYFPTVYTALTAALILVTGNSMRLVVLAEVLGTSEGLGFILSIARAQLDMPTLYGCVLISFGFVWGGELFIRTLFSGKRYG